MRGLRYSILALVLSVATAQLAGASLSQRDPDDVSFPLDIRRATSIARPRGDAAGMGIEFYRAIPDNEPRIKILYDAFGSHAADFALRFRVFDEGAACTFVRLSDHRRYSTSPTERRWRSLYCEFERPESMRRIRGVRWRVEAVLPEGGRDFAPNDRWYPHI